MKEIKYKALTIIRNNYYSFYSPFNVRLKYKVGEWTHTPKLNMKYNLGLLVFDTLENCKKLVSERKDSCIFTCEVYNPIVHMGRLPFHILAGYFNQFYKKPIYKIYQESLSPVSFPKGTECYESVKLLERIR